jgi:hypothetical protein
MPHLTFSVSRPTVCALLLVLSVLVTCYLSELTFPRSASVAGSVRDTDGPVAGASVRIRATENRTTSAADGSFTITGMTATVPVSVTAWAEGYFVGWTSAAPGSEPITITLKPYYATDNPNYTWFSMEATEGSKSCGHCMPSYAEWQADAHSQSAVNARFLTMYNGTDVHGNRSPPTRYAFTREYGNYPLRPDLRKPYYGPGYRLDFPYTAGNCATCRPRLPNREGPTPPTPTRRLASRPRVYSASSVTRSAT